MHLGGPFISIHLITYQKKVEEESGSFMDRDIYVVAYIMVLLGIVAVLLLV